MNKSAVLASASAKFPWQQQPILSLGISLAREGNETKKIKEKKKKTPTPKSGKICQIRSSISLPRIVFWGKSARIFFLIRKGVLFKNLHRCLRQKKDTANAFVPPSWRGRDHKHAEWGCSGGGNLDIAEHPAFR